jgi:hypothetical protein
MTQSFRFVPAKQVSENDIFLPIRPIRGLLFFNWAATQKLPRPGKQGTKNFPLHSARKRLISMDSGKRIEIL